MLQVQSGSSFHDANNQLLNYEHTTSQHSLEKISDKNSHSALSQTLANYQSVYLIYQLHNALSSNKFIS